MKKYKLENLGCRGCAAKMEQDLAQLPEVNGASIDFDRSILSLHGGDVPINVISAVVKRTEAGVEVVEYPADGDISQPSRSGKGFIASILSSENRKEVVKLGVASLLFAVGMVFEGPLKATPMSAGYYGVFLGAYLLCGLDIVVGAFKNLAAGHLFDEFFLMTVASFAATALGFLAEAVGVMLFYGIGEFLQDMAASSSRKSVKSLLASRPSSATVLKDGKTATISPESVLPGDILVVKPGEKVPIDGMVLTGSSQVDTSPITGESVPVSAGAGETLYGGSVNLSGVLTIRATSAYKDTAISRIMEMVEFAVAQKSPTERFITRFARYYTPAVVLLACAIAVLPPLIGYGAFRVWIYRALILLIISCPCALMVSIPLGYFGGIGAASRQGLLVKGGNVLDVLNDASTVVFDKTGTLTRGVFDVVSMNPARGVSSEALAEAAAVAEENSNHPIARSVMRACGSGIGGSGADMKEIPGMGIEAELKGHVILAGTAALLGSRGIGADAVDEAGTIVHVARDGKYLGYIVVSDVLKDDAVLAVKRLKDMGIKAVHMLTGDGEKTATAVSSALSLDGYKAGLLPHEKVEEISKLRGGKGKILFVGDGINDAPSLAAADAGIAMGGLGSEAAIETADMVILSDRPSEVADAIRIARRTRRIVVENIVLALGVKAAVLVLGVAGLSGLWEAVFADVGVALLAVLNSSRTVRMAAR